MPAPSGTLRLLAHPLRVAILRELVEDGELSPKLLTARIGGYTLPAVAYHVRALADAGVIVETRTEPRRGAQEHFYVPKAEAAKVVEAAMVLDRALAEAGAVLA